MSEPETVTVYAYRYFDPDEKGFLVAPCKAPLNLIHERFRGDPLVGSAEEVSVEELGRDGCYRRIASGWGVLD